MAVMLRVAFFLAACGLLCASPPYASGQSYPSRPVRLIVPFPPGGGNDILARTVGNRLTEVIGQQIVVDNRAGASTRLPARAHPCTWRWSCSGTRPAST